MCLIYIISLLKYSLYLPGFYVIHVIIGSSTAWGRLVKL